MKYFSYVIGFAIGLLVAQMGHYKMHSYHLVILAVLVLGAVVYEKIKE